MHRSIYKFVESRLGIVWHQKLTGLLHRDYFNEMACVVFSPAHVLCLSSTTVACAMHGTAMPRRRDLRVQ